MASHLRQKQLARLEGSRRQRRGCIYDAYLPDPLFGWRLDLPADVATDIADAEHAVRSLNASGTSHVSLEGLARFLLRAESVASSKIEGLNAASRRLARAEFVGELGGDARDLAAVEILSNIKAMDTAIELATEAERFGLDELLSVHRILMENSATPEIAGVVRTEQNWIGGNDFTPEDAVFVPPPPEYLEELLEDLFDYINGDEHPTLIQAAIAHAQFETLHPFKDGNGRAGRALIHVVLRRRGLAPAFVPPISLVLATWSKSYVQCLTGFRHLGEPNSRERSDAAVEWLRTFAATTSRACSDAQRYSDNIKQLSESWRAQLGRVRANSGTDLTLRFLPGVSILNVETLSALIGRSKARTTDAVNRLAQAGILTQSNIGRERYRVFEVTDVLDLFTDLERSLASPEGDTRTSQPNRRVSKRSP